MYNILFLETGEFLDKYTYFYLTKAQATYAVLDIVGGFKTRDFYKNNNLGNYKTLDVSMFEVVEVNGV